MMEVDWGDFVVVGKIDLYDDEEMKMIEDNEHNEAEALRRQSKYLSAQIHENEQFIAMPIPEMQQQQPAPTDVFISTALDPEMKIKKNYQRSTEEAKNGGTQRCPKCQQEIPIGEWKEHMRLEMMDPKHREEKLKREERAKLNSLASGDEIAANLKRFAQERKDIFPN